MELDEYSLLRRGQEDHWWYLGRRRILELLLRDHIRPTPPLHVADIGSGFGANIPILLPYGRLWALEMHEEALGFIQSRWPDQVACRRWRYPEQMEQTFDLLVLADVLEHIEDDAGFVAWMHDHVKPGGWAVITVPAHQILWTEMDEVVHHFRRYDRASLKALFEPHFSIERLTYYNSLLFPIKLAFVMFSRARRLLTPDKPKRSFNDVPPMIVNNIFKKLLEGEAQALRFLSLPFGVSLVLLARRST